MGAREIKEGTVEVKAVDVKEDGGIGEEDVGWGGREEPEGAEVGRRRRW